MTEGLLTKVTTGLKQFVASNPSVLTAKSLTNQKGGRITSKTQQSDSLCLAVNPPPFNKGGKCDGASKGWCGFGRVGGVTIPPVVARIFSGDSTSPLTMEARIYWFSWDSAENLIDGADGYQSPPSCRQNNCKYTSV